MWNILQIWYSRFKYYNKCNISSFLGNYVWQQNPANQLDVYGACRKVTLAMINVIHLKILHSGVAMDIILNFIQESNSPVLLTFGDKFIETQRSPIKLRLTARGQSKELFFRNQVYVAYLKTPEFQIIQLTSILQDSMELTM